MSTYCAAPAVLLSSVGGRAVLLNLRSQRCFALNATAATVWAALERCEPAERVVDTLCARFDVSRGSAMAALVQFLHQLEARGLIRVLP